MADTASRPTTQTSCCRQSGDLPATAVQSERSLPAHGRTAERSLPATGGRHIGVCLLRAKAKSAPSIKTAHGIATMGYRMLIPLGWSSDQPVCDLHASCNRGCCRSCGTSNSFRSRTVNRTAIVATRGITLESRELRVPAVTFAGDPGAALFDTDVINNRLISLGCSCLPTTVAPFPLTG